MEAFLFPPVASVLPSAIPSLVSARAVSIATIALLLVSALAVVTASGGWLALGRRQRARRRRRSSPRRSFAPA